ncbi:hypothetical protein JTE90_000889 [Oedothorax gibbosus]|uniref:Uncharacterized protein n=1 Tax=Oedothorax gibbosus TaxID=931172 RepID=A0AAV6VWE5_9ARAC|nr:hypothetical protein JTE90_000889 [Oedothorax gibbosus]
MLSISSIAPLLGIRNNSKSSSRHPKHRGSQSKHNRHRETLQSPQSSRCQAGETTPEADTFLTPIQAFSDPTFVVALMNGLRMTEVTMHR